MRVSGESKNSRLKNGAPKRDLLDGAACKAFPDPGKKTVF
jgi:hypothetical protein